MSQVGSGVGGQNSRKAGWLKESDSTKEKKTWKKRFFLLTENNVLYFFKEQPKAGVVKPPKGSKGVFPLSDYTDIVRDEDASPTPTKKAKEVEFVLRLHNQYNVSIRTLFLKADTEAEMRIWRKALADAIQEEKDKRKRRGTRGTSKSTPYERYRTLDITVGQTKGLKVSGDASPFVVLKVGDAQVKTEVSRGANAEFDADFHIDSLQDRPAAVHGEIWAEGRFDDKCVGRFVLPMRSLTMGKATDRWIALRPFDLKSYVSGEIRLQWILHSGCAELNELPTMKINIKEARNLASKDSNGFSDPYVTVAIGSAKFKSKVIKKNLNPKWSESFDMTLPHDKATWPRLVTITVWDWDKVGKNDFLGNTAIVLPDVQENRIYDDWFMLGDDEANPSMCLLRDEGEEKKEPVDDSSKEHGSVSLKVKYTEFNALGVEHYQPLMDVMAKQGHWAIGTLSQVVKTEKETAAHALVKIFASRKQEMVFLYEITKREINATEDPATIFRGNTVATKAVDYYQKIVGREHLRTTLHAPMQQLLTSKKRFEVDPSRLDKGENVEKNMDNLIDLVQNFLVAVFKTLRAIPPGMSLLYHYLREKMLLRFPQAEKARYSVIAGFYFLRYICPAILSPKAWGLVDAQPDKAKTRIMTLVAKSMQNMANLVLFGAKEPFMARMNTLIETNLDNMRAFLDQIAEPQENLPQHNANVLYLNKELQFVFQLFVDYLPKIREHCDKIAPRPESLARDDNSDDDKPDDDDAATPAAAAGGDSDAAAAAAASGGDSSKPAADKTDGASDDDEAVQFYRETNAAYSELAEVLDQINDIHKTFGRQPG